MMLSFKPDSLAIIGRGVLVSEWVTTSHLLAVIWIPKHFLEFIVRLLERDDFFVPGQFIAHAADLASLILKLGTFLNHKCL